MEYIEILAIIITIILIAGVSGRIRDSVITLPMLCALGGLFVGLVFASRVTLTPNASLVQIITQLTLLMLLATDASRIRLRRLFRYHDLPLRLLYAGLPLTILLGTALAYTVFRGTLTVWEAAVLAVIVAPTDTSPAERAVSNPRVPVRIRQALGIEAGLDDGIALPLLLATVLLAISHQEVGHGLVLTVALKLAIFAVLTGVPIGYLGAKYIEWGQKSGWMSSSFQKICWLALVLLTYVVAEWMGGNGILAAFFFGITSGNVIGRHEQEALFRFAEVENALLMLLTYVIFGMVLLPPALKHLNVNSVIFAVLSLAVVRMLAVGISVIGKKLRPITVVFMGWFGPRGISSILYVLAVAQVSQLAGGAIIYNVAMITVLLSVMAHGVSAAPLSNWYGKHVAKLDKRGAADAETEEVVEMPTRAVTAHASAER